MSKELIKKAWDLAEKEAQEKEINKVKDIVKAYLEKVDKQREVVKKDQETLRLLEKDIDDLKAGRLDKIEERQKIDSRAKETSLVIIHKVEKEYVPMYPWRSPYWIEWNPIYCVQTIPNNTITIDYNSNALNSGVQYYEQSANNVNSMVANGTTFSNFVGGTYDINGRIINL